MRERPCAACLGSNCGAFSFKSFSRFHTTASALKSLPSWNFTPSRRVKVQRVGSASSTFHEVARPGTSTEALSAEDRSQLISPS